MNKHDLGLFSVFPVVLVSEFEFSFGAKTDRSDDRVLAKFFLVVAVPSHPVSSIPVIVDED